MFVVVLVIIVIFTVNMFVSDDTGAIDCDSNSSSVSDKYDCRSKYVW